MNNEPQKIDVFDALMLVGELKIIGLSIAREGMNTGNVLLEKQGYRILNGIAPPVDAFIQALHNQATNPAPATPEPAPVKQIQPETAPISKENRDQEIKEIFAATEKLTEKDAAY